MFFSNAEAKNYYSADTIQKKLMYDLNIAPGSLEVLSIGLTIQDMSSRSIDEFIYRLNTPGTNLLISNNNNLRLNDGLGNGLYIQPKTDHSFDALTTSDICVINSVTIDSSASLDFIDRCVEKLAISRWTKNKKMVFNYPVQTRIIYSNEHEYMRVINLLNRHKNYYTNKMNLN